jgi:hypothetical protein
MTFVAHLVTEDCMLEFKVHLRVYFHHISSSGFDVAADRLEVLRCVQNSCCLYRDLLFF